VWTSLRGSTGTTGWTLPLRAPRRFGGAEATCFAVGAAWAGRAAFGVCAATRRAAGGGAFAARAGDVSVPGNETVTGSTAGDSVTGDTAVATACTTATSSGTGA
jgi:hypothetical protein